jgi:signal transduction histidine kinase
VREHADAQQVVVHLDAPEADPTAWILTVHDDGRGFDTESTDLSVGLREVVVEGLSQHGVDATVDSLPGSGTTITMTRRSTLEARSSSSVAAGRL